MPSEEMESELEKSQQRIERNRKEAEEKAAAGVARRAAVVLARPAVPPPYTPPPPPPKAVEPADVICSICGEACHPARAHPKAPGSSELECLDCARDRKIEEKLRNRPMQLAGARVPSVYRSDFNEPEGGWPQCPAVPDFDVATWRGRPWCITFAGPIGSGKSFYAAELLYRSRLKFGLGFDAAWMSASDIVRLAFDHSQDAAEELESRRTKDLLVIDDLGRGHSAAAAWGVVADLLFDRYSHKRPTIVTTNMSMEQLAGECGDLALFDRLACGLMVTLTGGTRRTIELPDAQFDVAELDHEGDEGVRHFRSEDARRRSMGSSPSRQRRLREISGAAFPR